jgi:Flp pilus assembly pilin Flp
MEYAVVSKTTARKGLRVRVPPPAHAAPQDDGPPTHRVNGRVAVGRAPFGGCHGSMICRRAEHDDQNLFVHPERLATLRSRESGQTMAEYAVVLAVITVAIVATLGFLAGGITKALSSVTSKL